MLQYLIMNSQFKLMVYRHCSFCSSQKVIKHCELLHRSTKLRYTTFQREFIWNCLFLVDYTEYVYISINQIFHLFQFLDIGVVTSVECNHKHVESARKGQEVCIKIEPIPGESPKMYGRHFDETDMLTSKVMSLINLIIILQQMIRLLTFFVFPKMKKKKLRQTFTIRNVFKTTLTRLFATFGFGNIINKQKFCNQK